jgi:hypothetical protein
MIYFIKNNGSKLKSVILSFKNISNLIICIYVHASISKNK